MAMPMPRWQARSTPSTLLMVSHGTRGAPLPSWPKASSQFPLCCSHGGAVPPSTTTVKAMSGDAAMPEPINLPRVADMKLSAEHTKIELVEPSDTPRIADKLEFIVGYSDTTVHLHETIVGVRSGVVETVWPVAARGKLT